MAGIGPDGRPDVTRVFIPALRAPPALPFGRRVRLDGDTMGTGWQVDAWLPESHSSEALRCAIEAALERVNCQMSTWRPDSFISRYAAAEPGSWLDAPDDFLIVLAEALRIAELSGGAFDPACGALVDLWGFGPTPAAVAPDEATLAAVRRRRGWRDIRIDGARVFQPGGVQLDLSGIAKGYAVDLAAAVLRQCGAPAALIEIGGELTGWGVKDDGAPWWVHLETPPGLAVAPPRALLALHESAVASSGDYRRRRTFAGREVSHTLDPGTGAPLGSFAPAVVTVVHDSCMTADALATALCVLGMEAGADFAARHGVAARLVARAGDAANERITPALAAMLG